MTRSKPQFQPLKSRTTSDDGFPNVVRLVGPGAAFAETIKEGQKLTWNDRNVFQIVTEVALAFIAREADGEGDLADASRDALQTLAQFRAISSPEAA